MSIAESLKRFRKEFKLTQKDVADVFGVTPQAYQVYESKVMPPASVIAKIAVTFNVSADYLLGLVDEPRPLHGTDYDTELVELAIAYNDALQKALERRKQAFFQPASD